MDRVEVQAGEPARTRLGIAVSFHSIEHDSFEGGRSDVAVQVGFQGIMDDGTLTPSELGWRPSVLAPPRWVPMHPMKFCVRLLEVKDDVLVLEMFPTSR